MYKIFIKLNKNVFKIKAEKSLIFLMKYNNLSFSVSKNLQLIITNLIYLNIIRLSMLKSQSNKANRTKGKAHSS